MNVKMIRPGSAWEIRNDHLRVHLEKEGLNLRIEDLAAGKILGFGKESYLLALRALDGLAKKDGKR